MYQTDLINQLPGYIGWKDKNLNHLGCNNNLSNLLRFKHNDQIIGLKDQDIKIYSEEFCLFHKTHDEFVLKGNTIQGLHKASSPYQEQLFFFVKKPLYDELNKITGIIYHCQEFLIHSPWLKTSDMNHFEIDPVSNEFNLSTRELECLFLVLRGKSAKEIGKKLDLSSRTIESYIENIKNKFGCDNKSALIESALAHGYMKYLPGRFVGAHYNPLFQRGL